MENQTNQNATSILNSFKVSVGAQFDEFKKNILDQLDTLSNDIITACNDTNEDEPAVTPQEVDAIERYNTLHDLITQLAEKKGIKWVEALADFIRDYNYIYRTNIRKLQNHYERENGVKCMDVIDFMIQFKRIDEGIMVAQEMLRKMQVLQ